MLQLPTTIAEHVADFSGIVVGFAFSPRSIAFGIIALVLGVFRTSVAWALLLAALWGISHLYLLSIAGRYIEMSSEYLSYSQGLTLSAAALFSVLWYSLGRILRSLKAPMLSVYALSPLKSIGDAEEIEVTPAIVAADKQSVEFQVPTKIQQVSRPFLNMLMVGLFFLLLVGFGLQTYRAAPPETPVLFGYVKQPGQGLVWRYATVECVRNGQSLEGYVWSREEMMNPINVFDLQPEISIGSLAQARDLARKMRSLRDADPMCSQADGFVGRSQPLVFSLFW